jgi:hypothetical protein
MNGTKRKIGTLIATLGLAVTAGGVTAALAAGSSTPSPTPTTISSTPPGVNDDGTADRGHGDVTTTGTPAMSTPGVGDDGTADQGPGDVPAEQGQDHGDNRGPGHAEDDGNHGPGNQDDGSGQGEGVQHG